MMNANFVCEMGVPVAGDIILCYSQCEFKILISRPRKSGQPFLFILTEKLAHCNNHIPKIILVICHSLP